MAQRTMTALVASAAMLAAAGGAWATEFPMSVETPVYVASLGGLSAAMTVTEGRSAAINSRLDVCAPGPGAMFPIVADIPCAPPESGVAFEASY